MPRASIVIGVGGTGVSVLSWVKKNLLETYGASQNIPVRLLLIDVVQPDVMPGRAGVEDTEYGADNFKTQYLDKKHDIDLDKEFVQLAKNIRFGDVEIIKRGLEQNDARFEHFKWYRNGTFPNALESNLRDGAGQLRQLGRLSLVQGLHSRGNADVLYTRLSNLIASISDQSNGNIDIHIVGSFAGGTGSGIFMDVAWLVRKLADEANVNAFITGFFAMPDALAQISTDIMSVKSFNAWRELNRMMLVRRERGSNFEVVWGGDGSDRAYQVEKPIFDHIYLAAKPIGGAYRPPNTTLFPMIGEAISFFLDSEAGNAYIQRIRQNAARVGINERYFNRPTYSTFYVRSMKLPAYNSRVHLKHEIAQTLLNRLLQVRITQATPEALKELEEQRGNERSGATTSRRGQIEVANLARIIELENSQCGDQVTTILTGDMTLDGIGNTLFITRQAEWLVVTAAAQNDEINYWIDQNLYELYVTIPDNEEGKALQFNIDRVMDFALQPVPSTNDHATLKNYAENLYDQIYGNNAIAGRYHDLYGDFVGEQARGNVYQVLGEVHKLILKTFKQRLMAWVSYILNNRPNGVGLGCVLSALEKLRFDIEGNLRLLEAISKALPNVLDLREECKEAYNELMTFKGWNLPVLRPVARLANDWYEAEERHLKAMQNRRAIQRMVDTQRAILAFIEDEALMKARAVESKLVTGDRVQNITSVYEQVYTRIMLEDQRSKADEVAKGVVDVLETHESIDAGITDAIDDIMEYVSWDVQSDFSIDLVFNLPGQQPVRITSATGDEGRRDVERFTSQLLNTVAEQALNTAQTNALDALAPQLRQFVTKASDVNNLLYVPSHGGQPQQAIRTFFIQCDPDTSVNVTVDNIRDIFPSLDIPVGGNGNYNTVDIVGTENKNKVVIFHALEMLHPEDFQHWETSKNNYWRRILGQDRGHRPDLMSVRADHLFLAEQNALDIEHRFVDDPRYKHLRDSDYPILDSRIVHVLEHKQRFLNFLKLWTLGYVQEQRGTHQAWLLVLPEHGGQSTYELDVRNRDTDILQMITRFVIGNEDRNRNRYSHRDIQNKMDEIYNEDWFTSSDRSRELLQRFRYEAQIAQDIYGLIKRNQGEIINFDNFSQQVDTLIANRHNENDTVKSLYRGDEPQRTLAEAVVSDLIMKRDFALNYVQLLQIVLPLLFDELAIDVEDFRKGNRWN